MDQLNSVALPTATETLFKKMREKAKTLTEDKNKNLLSKYGGEEHLQNDYDLILGQSERYVEYSRDGKVGYFLIFFTYTIY